MVSSPTSHFITLPNRPLILEDGTVGQGPLTIHFWQWAGNGGPTVLLCHAASFHGRCYDRIIEGALRGYHVIAIDFRGHGRSQKHPPPYHARWFGEDLVQFIEQLDLPSNDIIGIGHSMGGYSLTLAAATAPTRRFKMLLLLDPGILPRIAFQTSPQNELELYAHILRRKSQWSSIDDMIARLEKRDPFARWQKDVLRDYCTYALDENYCLACTPKAETSIYVSACHPDSAINKILEEPNPLDAIPVRVVRSKLPYVKARLNTSPTTPDLVQYFKKGQDIHLTNVEHLFPMEQVEFTIDLVKDMLDDYKSLCSRL